LASTDITIASKSDYIVTVTAALAASPAVTKSDTLTLKIRNSCVNSISLANSVAYDWILKTGTKTFSYNMLIYFNTACPGETLTPTYTFTGLNSNIVENIGSSNVDWTLGTFTSDAVYTVAVVGHLSAPHTMTIKYIVTINVQTVCTTAT
jgi:hypothetical protein